MRILLDIFHLQLLLELLYGSIEELDSTGVPEIPGNMRKRGNNMRKEGEKRSDTKKTQLVGYT